MKNRREIRSLTNIKNPSSPLNKTNTGKAIRRPSFKLKAIKSLTDLKISTPKYEISSSISLGYTGSSTKFNNCLLEPHPSEPLKKMSQVLPPLNQKFQISSSSNNSAPQPYKIKIRFKGFHRGVLKIPESDPLISLSKDLPYIENVLQENRDKVMKSLISPNPVIETYEEAFGDIESDFDDDSRNSICLKYSLSVDSKPLQIERE